MADLTKLINLEALSSYTVKVRETLADKESVKTLEERVTQVEELLQELAKLLGAIA